VRVIYTAKRNVEKVWGVRYTFSARYLSKNTVFIFVGAVILIYFCVCKTCGHASLIQITWHCSMCYSNLKLIVIQHRIVYMILHET
jgi:hypothetical protein